MSKNKFRECTECRSFVECESPKQYFHKSTGIPCKEFEEAPAFKEQKKQIDNIKLWYRMGVLCGEMLYYTMKFDTFEAMMQYCADVDKKHGWDMFACRFCFQAFKDDSYNFEKACILQIEMPVNNIDQNKASLAERILKAYEKTKGEDSADHSQA